MASLSYSEAHQGRGCSFWPRPFPPPHYLFLVMGWEVSINLWGGGEWRFYAQKPGWELINQLT